MKLLDSYPLITVKDTTPSRDFFVNRFGFDVIFESSWVTMLGNRRTGRIALGLMTADHPTSPPGPEVFDGRGVLVTIQVTDAGKAADELKRGGATLFYDLHDEPWGQRRFALRDPAGILVDVVEQTEPTEGWWDEYMAAPAAA